MHILTFFIMIFFIYRTLDDFENEISVAKKMTALIIITAVCFQEGKSANDSLVIKSRNRLQMKDLSLEAGSSSDCVVPHVSGSIATVATDQQMNGYVSSELKDRCCLCCLI